MRLSLVMAVTERLNVGHAGERRSRHLGHKDVTDNHRRRPMLFRNATLTLAALAVIASTVLAPQAASARGYHNGNHIIVVCRKLH
jgi:hypothetical protein